MKIIVAILIILISFNSMACLNMIPESEIERHIQSAPYGVQPLFSCTDKPEEQCLCADGIDWSETELVTEISQDDLGINIEKKVLKNSAAKKALRQAEKEAEKLADDEKKAKRKLAKDKVKSFKFKGATIKELRDELNEFADGNSKAQDE